MIDAHAARMLSIGIALFAGIALAQPGQPEAPPGIAARDIRGGGAWQTKGKKAAPTQRWDLQVTRGDDNSIHGRVNLVGSPLAKTGNVEGHVSGSDVSGTITDDNGNPVATFTGSVGPKGMSGAYTDRSGETGSWSWDGSPPQ